MTTGSSTDATLSPHHPDPAVGLLALALRRHLAQDRRVADAAQGQSQADIQVPVASGEQSSVRADAPLPGV